MRNCFVPKCDALAKNPSRTMFVVPWKDPVLFRQWQEILPQHHRKLKQHDRVCERHFREEDVIRFWQHTINGQTEVIPRDKPLLRVGALPLYNHDETQSQTQTVDANQPRGPAVSRRRPQKGGGSSELPAKKVKLEQALPQSECSSGVVASVVHKINGSIDGHPVDHNIIIEVLAHPDFETLYDEVYEIELPSTLWGIHRDLEKTFIAFTEFSKDSMSVRKYLYVDQSLQYRMAVGQRTMKTGTLASASTDAITELLAKLDEIKVRKVIIKGSSSVLNES